MLYSEIKNIWNGEIRLSARYSKPPFLELVARLSGMNSCVVVHSRFGHWGVAIRCRAHAVRSLQNRRVGARRWSRRMRTKAKPIVNLLQMGHDSYLDCWPGV